MSNNQDKEKESEIVEKAEFYIDLDTPPSAEDLADLPGMEKQKKTLSDVCRVLDLEQSDILHAIRIRRIAGEKKFTYDFLLVMTRDTIEYAFYQDADAIVSSKTVQTSVTIDDERERYITIAFNAVIGCEVNKMTSREVDPGTGLPKANGEKQIWWQVAILAPGNVCFFVMDERTAKDIRKVVKSWVLRMQQTHWSTKKQPS